MTGISKSRTWTDCEVLPSLWSPEQKQVLANYGISLEDVNSSYRWLLHELSPLKMHRFGPAGDLSRETVKKLACERGNQHHPSGLHKGVCREQGETHIE